MDFLDFLKTRQGKLEGVCITGGEPTLQPDLVDFIKQIKDLGFTLMICRFFCIKSNTKIKSIQIKL